MSKTVVAIPVSLLALAAMVFLLMSQDDQRTPLSGELSSANAVAAAGGIEVSLFCAASNQSVMEDIRRAYEAETGRKILIQYGASQTLLSQIEVSGTGDLFLPADDSYLTMAREKQLVNEMLQVASMRCVLVVRKGNPKHISELSDVFAEDVRFVQASPDAAAVGRLTKNVTTKLGIWDKLETATDAYRTTVTDVANDLVVNAADAGIVYDAVVHAYPDLEIVEVPEFSDAVAQVSIGIVSSSKHPAAALHFARYIVAEDRGLQHYRRHGFRTNRGTAWSESLR